MKVYNVLWFDDEHERLETIKENALLNQIRLAGFNNAKDGLDELKRRLEFYDAVLVDGMFYNVKENTGDTVSDEGFISVARGLDEIAYQKKFPWFILSGQTSFTNVINPFAKAYKENKIYNKNFDEDYKRLWTNIKSEADQVEDTQIKHQFQSVFEACTANYIGENSAKCLISILKKGNALEAFKDPEIYFNPLRKIIEAFFKACNKKGLLPNTFISGSVSLNESSKFFSGSPEKNYQLIEPTFPGKIIVNNIRNVVTISQSASHMADVDEFVQYVNTPYLLMSITYQLMDILVWFKRYVDENPDNEKNKKLYKSLDNGKQENLLTGIIEQDENRNYHCDDCLLSFTNVQLNYKIGDKIKIFQWSENTKEKTRKAYPKFASKFEQID